VSNRKRAAGAARPKTATAANRQPAAPTAAARPAQRTYGGVTLSQIRGIFFFILAAGIIVYLVAQSGAIDSPSDGSAEAGFARDMKTHHGQAVEMAMIVRDRTTDPEIRTFVTDMLLTQQNQIGQFEGWLGVWGLPLGSEAKPMAWMGHEVDGLMPGMATSDQVAALAEMPHDDMVRSFLELMIVHHQSAVDMAQAVLERSDEPAVTRMAQAIIDTQASEIARMEEMLARYGVGGDPAATPGASPVADLPATAEGTPHDH
jgi:uncharacterized protein (DUF305 family)